MQNEAGLFDERLQLIGSLHYDSYRLTPRSDAVFQANNAANAANLAAAQEITANALSPKFGTTYKLNKVWSAFANYAYGFRAPSALEAQAALLYPGA